MAALTSVNVRNDFRNGKSEMRSETSEAEIRSKNHKAYPNFEEGDED